jgi:hypothetical protein
VPRTLGAAVAAVTALGALGATLALTTACGGEDYLVVTVSGRPSVHDVATLRVTVANAGTMRTDDLPLKSGTSLPATFSLSTPGRTGDLTLGVEALSSAGQLVGSGDVVTQVGATEAKVLLDGADFVVNTTFADDQLLSNDLEAIGFQLAALSDGVWTATFRGACASPCNMFARRFDATGTPVSTVLAAGASEFPVSTTLTSALTTPAIAANSDTTVVLWDYHDVAEGIACRSLDRAGASPTTQRVIAAEGGADVVSATALANGNFVAVWTSTIGGVATTRSGVFGPDCAVITIPVSVSAAAGSARRATVAARPDGTLYAWVAGGAVRTRTATATGGLTGTDTLFASPSATQTLDYVRVTSLGDGFGVVVRTRATDMASPGAIWLYRTTLTGTQTIAPTLITDKSGSDFDANNSFGVATRKDGALLIVWHACGTNGDGSGCGVFGRIVRPSGVPVGDAFPLATTTVNDQTNPSAAGLDGAFAVAWNDKSGVAPDISGSAVRARIVYPRYDDAQGVLGARCGQPSTAACATGLACLAGTDNQPRCYVACDPAATPPLCPTGGSCTKSGAVAGCIY